MVPSLAAGAGTGVPLLPGTLKNGVRAERSPDSLKTCSRGMVPSPTPKRDHGDPQSFGFEARAKGSWCGRRDLNPHGPCGPTDFHTRLRLSPPLAFLPGFGVWTIPSPCPEYIRSSGAARLVSTPSQPEADFSGRAWLGIAMLQGSPNLSSSASPVSRRALKFSLKSARPAPRSQWASKIAQYNLSLASQSKLPGSSIR